MSRISQGTVVFLSGLVLLAVTVMKLHLRYVKPEFGGVLIATGIILIVLSLLTLRQPKPVPAGHPAVGHAHADHDGHDHGDGDCGHDHSKGPHVGWTLLAPAVIMALIVPPSLGADAASRQSDVPRQQVGSDASLLPPLPAGDPADIDLSMFTMHATTDNGQSLKGRQVKMVGFVTPAKDGKGWYVTRMTLQCCAADAFAFKVLIENQPAPATDTWVEVTGEHIPGDAARQLTDLPKLNATSVRPTTAPSPPYL